MPSPTETLLMLADQYCKGERSADAFLADLDRFEEFFDDFERKFSSLQPPPEFPEAETLQEYSRDTLDMFRDAVFCMRQFVAGGAGEDLELGVKLAGEAHSRMQELQNTTREFAGQPDDFFLA